MPSVISHAWQSWKATPGIALLAIVAFAVGIGSATAIFTVINGVMLRPLPYPEGERFVTLFGARVNEPGRYMASTFPDLIEYQGQTTSFDVFGWFRLSNFNLTSPGESQYLSGVAVTTSLVHNIDVDPALGRWFDDETGAVISNTLWTRLGGDPTIIGTAITLDDRRLTITGVMGSGFRLPVAGMGPYSRADVWIALDALGKGEPRDQGLYYAYARRKPGVSLAQAQADAKRVAARIAERDPKGHPLYTAAVSDLRETTFRELRSVLIALFASAGLVLLISCANVATLLLSRSVARARETAIRVALGASRRQLAMRYFVDASMVSLPGAVLGLGLSLALTRVILLAGSEYIPYADEIAVEWGVLAFGIALAFVTGALTTIAPLWQAMRTAPNAVLTEGVRASAGARARRLSHALVVAEIALAFTLLTVSAILVFHLQGLLRVATGFDPDNLLTFQVTVPGRILSSAERVPYQRRLIDALRAVPGVTAVTFSNQLPLQGCCVGGTIQQDGGVTTPDTRRVAYMFVTPAYLETMRIPLRAGRFIADTDDSDAIQKSGVLPVAINEAAATRYWPARSPIGAYGRLSQTDGQRFQVVGVVGDVRNDGLQDAPEAEVYLLSSVYPMNPMEIIIRSPLPAERLVPDVRRAIQGVDRTLSLFEIQTMNEIVNSSLQLERVSSLMLVFFAITAVLMATLGIYGVVAYGVRQQTVEIGTRMALGALSHNLLTLIVGRGLRMAGAGIVVGAVALVGAVWALMELLEVRDAGWPPFAISTALVATVTVAASYAPAWRAARLSPMVAIRGERTSALHAAGRRLRRALDQVRQTVSGGADEAPSLSPTAVLSDFVDAARTAESYHGALQQVLASLCAKLDVRSALLLERTHDGLYHRRVAVGGMDAAIQTLPGEGFLAQRLRAYPLPLPFVAGELGALIEWAEGNRPGRVDEIRSLAAADVRLAVPLRTRTETIGVLLMSQAGDRASYSGDEKHVLRTCADQFALMLENGRLTERVVEQETVRRDLALAVEVQRRLLPAVPPSEPFAEFAAISVPARSIGGDYYDFIQTCEHQVGIAIADVSGKGIAAALIMSVVQASLRIVTAAGDVPLPRLAATLNTFLYRSTPASKYATFFYAQVDSALGQLRYVNAGHNPPYLFRQPRAAASVVARAVDATRSVEIDRLVAPDAEVQELTVGGMVVGMFPDADYEEAVVDLFPGDLLVAFTDGVPEAHNPAGEEFGEERLKAIVRGALTLTATEITERLAQTLRDWIQDAEQYDDLTVVVMRVS
jgi:putative ABC transport system permease protein